MTPASKKFAPTPQQQAVYDFRAEYGDNIIVIAVAGSGKTSTIFEDINRTRQRDPRARIAYAAFNVKIRNEFTKKLTDAGIAVQKGSQPGIAVKTANGFGHGAWWFQLSEVGKKSDPDDKKNRKLCEKLEIPEKFHSFVCDLVSLAKQRAFGIVQNENSFPAWADIVDHHNLMDSLCDEEDQMDPEELMAEGIRHALNVLKLGREVARDHYDYDDQVYMPLYAKCRFKQYDELYVDEAQDTNIIRRLLYRAMLAPGGRIMFVGDPHQAIYGFTGADADALEIIKAEFKCREFPLSVCFRCDQDIVAEAQEDVDHIQAAPGKPKGNVCYLSQKEFNIAAKGSEKHLTCPQCYSVFELHEDSSDYLSKCPDCGGALTRKLELRWDDAIVCRNTKPLVEQAFALIRAGVACHVEGRSIGEGLAKLAKKWTKVKTLDKLRDKLEDYKLKQMEKYMEKDQPAQAELIQDKVETLYVIMDSLPPGATVNTLHAKIDDMFKDTREGEKPKNLTLCTIHKAKGLEWERMFLLGRNKFMPSKWAQKEWELEQEKNLSYVAKTRAMHELIYINVE